MGEGGPRPRSLLERMWEREAPRPGGWVEGTGGQVVPVPLDRPAPRTDPPPGEDTGGGLALQAQVRGGSQAGRSLPRPHPPPAAATAAPLAIEVQDCPLVGPAHGTREAVGRSPAPKGTGRWCGNTHSHRPPW